MPASAAGPAGRPVRRLPKLPSLRGPAVFRRGRPAAAARDLPRRASGCRSWSIVYSTIFFPIDGGSLGLVVALFIVGAALSRRKRIGWTIAIVVGGLVLLGDLLTIILIVAASLSGAVPFVDLAALARAAFNLAAVGAAARVHDRLPGRVLGAADAGQRGQGAADPGDRAGRHLRRRVPADHPLPERSGRSARPAGWIADRILDALLRRRVRRRPASDAGPPGWINTVVGLLIAITLIAALLVLLRSQRRAAWMDPADEPRVRALVAQSTEDSLAYFNTRRDKSVVFSETGRAAVSYRVDLGVCLASSDPIGPPDNWPGAIEAWFGPDRHVRLDARGDRGQRGGRHRVRQGGPARHPARRRGGAAHPGVPPRQPRPASGPAGGAPGWRSWATTPGSAGTATSRPTSCSC